jgi:signal peptidase I
VLIKGVESKSDIKIGDIIVYQNRKGFTIHRVIKINDETVTTKGDANNISDAPVKYKEIIGKTFMLGDKPLRIPMLGNISIKINNKKI